MSEVSRNILIAEAAVGGAAVVFGGLAVESASQAQADQAAYNTPAKVGRMLNVNSAPEQGYGGEFTLADGRVATWSAENSTFDNRANAAARSGDLAVEAASAQSRVDSATSAVEDAFEVRNTSVGTTSAIEQRSTSDPDSLPIGTKAECTPKMLAPATVTQAEMLNPGQGPAQTTYIGLKLKEITDIDCSRWLRIPEFLAQIKRGGKWIASTGNNWAKLGYRPKTDSEEFETGTSFPPTTHIFERKIKGQWEKARFLYRNVMVTAAAKKTVAIGKAKSHPIEIK